MKKISLLIVVSLLLLAPLAGQSVKVVSPNGGEPWVLNSSQAITWNSTNPGDVKVDIILRRSNNTKVGVIKSQVSLADGSWPWLSVGKLEDGTVIAPGTDYIVRIRDAANTFSDDSNAAFTISGAPPPGGPASITVISPNGGESWIRNFTKNITWKAENWTGTVRLELWQNGVDKGDIASGIPSSPGNYPWPVGKLVSGSAGIGSGYTVRVVKEYKGMPAPVPLAQLKDESDGVFSISFIKMEGAKPVIQQIKVISPKEGDVFTYGPYAGPNTYGIQLTIQWQTHYAPPFILELQDTGGKKLWEIELGSEFSVQQLPDGKLYSMKHLFVPENQKFGWYRFRIVHAGGLHSGFSGNFRLREVKILEDTIAAGIDNHEHSKYIDYSFGHLFSFGKKTRFQNLPARARVGFANKYETASAGQYASLDFVFRSQLTIDLKRFKYLKGEFLSASLYLERKEHHNNYQNGINLCGDKLYVLSGPWGQNNVMETPGVLLKTLSQSEIGQHIDVTKWLNAWLSGQSPNYGLLLTSVSESFSQDNTWCVSYFHAVFNIKFRTEK